MKNYKIGQQVILKDGTPEKYYGGNNYFRDTYYGDTKGYITGIYKNDKTGNVFYTFSKKMHNKPLWDNFDPIIYENDLKTI